MFTWLVYYYYKFYIFVTKIILETLLCNNITLHTFYLKFKIYMKAN